MSLEGAIAVHRFGLGARPGELEKASAGPQAWLKAQIGPAEQPEPLDGGSFEAAGTLVKEERADAMARNAALKQGLKPADLQADAKNRMQIFTGEMVARFQLGFSTARPFAEHLVWFWSNHFTVSATAGRTLNFAGAFERQAIRPYIAGRFEDMLLAVTIHPAMQVYLNNAVSVGPHSPAGQRTGQGRNENLGRELMELYSLGVDGGYTQADVIALANILTGWSLDPNSQLGFNFFPARHEPGTVILRGRSYPPTFEGGVRAVRDLARDPHTARHIATKMATYFIADTPSDASIARLEKTFLQTGGDLKALSETLVDDPAAWIAQPVKMRTPVEYVTAAYRLLDLPRAGNEKQQIQGAMAAARGMGEFPFTAPSPKGWPLTSDAWSGPDALMTRIEWAKQLGARLTGGIGAVELAMAGLGPLLSRTTMDAMGRAGTAGDALALMLSSPEFQRR
jgi:uncharacterized protein (DUF1800 family)